MVRSLPEHVRVIGIIVVLTVVTFIFPYELSHAVSADAAQSSDGAEQAQKHQDSRVVAVLVSVGQTENARKQFREIPNLDLLEINGMPMIMHVYNALCRSRYVQKIVVVAAPEIEKELDLKQDPPTSFVIDRGDAAENVEFGIDEVSKGDLIMFIPSDLVLVTPEGLDSLIERVLEEKDVDIFFPIVSQEVCEKKYPEERRTYARFEEGPYTGAHVEFLRPDLFLEHADEVKANKDSLYNVYYMRKNTLGIVRFLGLKLTLKYVFGMLSPHDVEQHVFDKYRVTAKAIYWDDPDLATDLSEPSDIPMIQRALEQRALAHSQVPPTRSHSTPGADMRSGA